MAPAEWTSIPPSPVLMNEVAPPQDIADEEPRVVVREAGDARVIVHETGDARVVVHKAGVITNAATVAGRGISRCERNEAESRSCDREEGRTWQTGDIRGVGRPNGPSRQLPA